MDTGGKKGKENFQRYVIMKGLVMISGTYNFFKNDTPSTVIDSGSGGSGGDGGGGGGSSSDSNTLSLYLGIF